MSILKYWLWLTTRNGLAPREQLAVLRHFGTPEAAYCAEKDALRGMGLWALRLQFTTENPGEIDKVLMDYQGRAVFDAGSYTRGLYSRGVE